jgi:hypothetical protein
MIFHLLVIYFHNYFLRVVFSTFFNCLILFYTLLLYLRFFGVFPCWYILYIYIFFFLMAITYFVIFVSIAQYFAQNKQK